MTIKPSKWECIIGKDGQIVTSVIERGNSECSHVKQFTGGLGCEISDEQTGPECDNVHEVQC